MFMFRKDAILSGPYQKNVNLDCEV